MKVQNKFRTIDLSSYVRVQKNTFFSKSDYPLPSKTAHRLSHNDRLAVQQIFYSIFVCAPRSIRRCAMGTFHRVYRIVLSEQMYVIRIWSGNTREVPVHFFIQEGIIKLLAHTGIPFAHRAVIIDTSRRRAPFDFEIFRVVPGIHLYSTAGKKKDLSCIHKTLGEYIARLHSIRLKGYGRLVFSSASKKTVRGCQKSWRAYLLTQLDRHIEYCYTEGFISSLMRRKIRSRILSAIKRVTLHSPRLLHGDLAHHNLFSDEKSITSIIDWEDALAGDPVYDIAYWGTGSFGNEQWLASFLRGYESIQPIPRDFALRYWLYYLRIALAKTVARHRMGKSDTLSSGIRFSDRITQGLSKLDSILQS